MAIIKTLLIVMLVFGLTACAMSDRTPAFVEWLQGVERQAIAEGVPPTVAHEALDHIVPDNRVVDLDQKQPESSLSFDEYAAHIVSADRVEEGRSLLRKNAVLLQKVSQQYGVAPEIIVALWGIESSFGRDSGNFKVVDSLATLAYEGRRADFFRKELLAALKILDQEHMPSSALRGSWAGAMGQCQFMPSTYLHHAVDYDGRGRHDIWGDRADIFASIANYLASEGWRPNLSWGREVELMQDINVQEIGLDHNKLLAQWQDLGVRSLGGDDLPGLIIEASLVQPDGPSGRSFLVYDNFRALMRWNRSTYFATSVGLLADRIK